MDIYIQLLALVVYLCLVLIPACWIADNVIQPYLDKLNESSRRIGKTQQPFDTSNQEKGLRGYTRNSL